eukprot:TRINITY_DN10257_c0_g1_i3.p1 TRINITY_DN10257_c0_g1~~TRINITY_DN10257_c0_g1_i3.p1  ORF type:complete len:332 (-),score=46.94 TRINITY_DN10257_c0_g1_i3:49-1044(-)
MEDGLDIALANSKLTRKARRETLNRFITKDSEMDETPLLKMKLMENIYNILQSDKLLIVMSLISALAFTSIIVAAEAENKIWMDVGVAVEIILNFILLLEPIARFIVIGFRRMSRRWYWLLEFIFSFSILFALCFYWYAKDHNIIDLITYALIFRIVRVLQIFQFIKAYRIIFETISKLIPLFVDIFGVLFFLFYFYCVAGIHIFGGKLNSSVVLSDKGVPNDYIYNNFNDFASGLVTLFELLMVNNWNVQMLMFAYIFGSDKIKLFFISFYVFGFILALGIIIAFIIDVIVDHLSAAQLEQQKATIGQLKRRMTEEVLKDADLDKVVPTS